MGSLLFIIVSNMTRPSGMPRCPESGLVPSTSVPNMPQKGRMGEAGCNF